MTDMTAGDTGQDDGEVWLTSGEAAELLPNVSRRSVQAWAASGKIDGVVRLPSGQYRICLLYTSPSPRDRQKSRMPSSA